MVLSGTASASTTANASGNYSFSALANGAYIVQVTKSGYTFAPSSQPVTIANASVSGINFTAQAISGGISGTISPASLGSGARVTLGSGMTTTADGVGNYSFSGVPNGTITVTPTKFGYSFAPASQSVTVSGGTVPGVNYTILADPRWTVSGTISPALAGSGTTITMSGPASATVTANGSGNFSFTDVADGVYVLTPSKIGQVFTPSSRTATVSGANLSGMDFQIQAVPTWSISGAISPALAGSGATVTLTGAATATVSADASGSYSLGGLASGTYTVTPLKSGYTFLPATQSVTVSGANVSGVGFLGQAVTPGIQSVQTAVAGSEPAVLNISASFPSNNIAGNFLIVTGTAARPAGTITISDTAGNTYVPAVGPVTDGPQEVTAYIWYVQSARAGANRVTLTPTGPRAMEIHISEWSGVATSAPVDQTAVASGFGTAASSGTRTTTANGELIFGYTFIGNSGTEGAGFTRLTLVNGDLDDDLIQPSAGPIAATFTQSAGDWLVLMATFRPAIVDTTGPTVSVTAPANDALLSGPVTLSATAADSAGVAGVQFRLDGVNLGAEATTAPYSAVWNTTTAAEGPHSVTAVARDNGGNTTTSAPVSVVVGNTSTAVVGQWSAPFELGLVAVNAVMLRTGKVLMYSGSFATAAAERVWDPVTGNLTLVPNPYFNLFCSGHSQLADGRILVVGGYDTGSLGAADANIFDPVTQSWSALPNMAYRRWYPTSTTLPDGRALVTSGAQTCLTCLADVPEIFDPATNQFTKLTSGRLAVPYYPFMFVLPDGKVINAGANEATAATQKLDMTTGTWSMVDAVVKDGHSAAMYQPGKILKSGTAADSGTPGNAAATAYVLDATQLSPAWRQVASMAHPRAFHNTTLLPDGTVLVTGGGTILDGYDVTKAVKNAELWSPTTETWRTLSAASKPRLYHSTALLLPDGRVFTAGSGNDGPAVNQTMGELFSPPYLFKGPRPTISDAPDLLLYGAAFAVATPDAASIASVSLIRPGAVTHSFDEDQRFLNLSFTAGGGLLTIQAPVNANLAPPGYYMLFLVNSAGVPSVATFVHFAAPVSDTEPPAAPSGLSGQGAIGSATLTWTASSDNTGVALYNVHRSTTPSSQPTVANRIGQPTTTGFTDASVIAGTYFYVVTAQDIAGNVSGSSSEVSVYVFADTTAPTVTMTSPADIATVSGSIVVQATASDDIAVAGVQFRLDSQPLGAERTTPPYSVTWDSATASNGSHVLTATAHDAAGNSAVATANIVVSNTAQTPGGLVAAYGFNQGSGVQATDASGQGNTGTISSATWTAAGKFGAALSFNGTSAWVTVADAASLDLTSGLTIEAWVNPTSGSAWRTVVLKENAPALAYALVLGQRGLASCRLRSHHR